MPRLFVAIRPPRSIRDQLMKVMTGVEGARWQGDDQLHMTLRFIGEVDGRLANDVADMLGTIRSRRFDIALDGIGMFDRKGRIDTLWCGVRPHEPLAALHRKIDNALVRLGLSPEGRAYLPHITLARFGRQAGPIDAFAAAYGGLSSAPFPVVSFALFESRLGSDGASYDAICSYALD